MNDGASVGPEQALERVATALAAMGSGDPGPMRRSGPRMRTTDDAAVTHVLRRIDGKWRLVHRHADFPPPNQRRS
jgi:hypothetical protein